MIQTLVLFELAIQIVNFRADFGLSSAVKLKLEEIPPNLEVTDQYVFGPKRCSLVRWH
ncbi:MAG: hypothetical protein CM15mP62_17280 [Rhodospirillaceae bacterium]|nr:MAG: hypothetical protein CM15mP62_17280 [Rhodospirillaceae bacterium]